MIKVITSTAEVATPSTDQILTLYFWIAVTVPAIVRIRAVVSLPVTSL